LSKSLGNTIEPQKVMKDSGADILRLWCARPIMPTTSGIGPNPQNTIETFASCATRSAGCSATLHHFKRRSGRVADMPELERLMLHNSVRKP